MVLFSTFVIASIVGCAVAAYYEYNTNILITQIDGIKKETVKKQSQLDELLKSLESKSEEHQRNLSSLYEAEEYDKGELDKVMLKLKDLMKDLCKVEKDVVWRRTEVQIGEEHLKAARFGKKLINENYASISDEEKQQCHELYQQMGGKMMASGFTGWREKVDNYTLNETISARSLPRHDDGDDHDGTCKNCEYHRVRVLELELLQKTGELNRVTRKYANAKARLKQEEELFLQNYKMQAALVEDIKGSLEKAQERLQKTQSSLEILKAEALVLEKRHEATEKAVLQLQKEISDILEKGRADRECLEKIKKIAVARWVEDPDGGLIKIDNEECLTSWVL